MSNSLPDGVTANPFSIGSGSASAPGRWMPRTSTTHAWSTAVGSSARCGDVPLVVVARRRRVIGAQVYGGDLTLAMKALAPGMMVMGIISSWARSAAPT